MIMRLLAVGLAVTALLAAQQDFDSHSMKEFL